MAESMKIQLQRIFTLIMAFVFISSPITSLAFATGGQASFSDVPVGHWAYDYVEELADEGIINGRPNGTYGTNDPVKRQHVSKMITGALGLEVDKSKQPSFQDVPAGNEFTEFIAATEDAGIFGGKQDRSFGWNENITRRQIANVIVRAFNLKEGDIKVEFTDINFPGDPEATKNIRILASNGIVKGYDDNTYRPNEGLKRAQFAKILVEARNAAIPKGTKEQEQALKSAESYLEFMAFSRMGLIKQLEFEGFSRADATYAVDKLDVNWKEQAVRSGEEYLEFTAFSRSGLIGQLEFEGFTNEEATYGVDKLDVNWKEQAVRSGEEYLEFMEFSRSGLIGQLEYDGFNRADATYAADQLGL